MEQILFDLLSGLQSVLVKSIPVILCAVFPVLLVIGRKANAPREERWKNALRPYYALIFAAIGCTSILLFNSVLNGLFDNPTVKPFLERVLGWLNLSDRLDYGFLIYKTFAINVAAGVAYLIFKYGGKGLKFLTKPGVRLLRWAVNKLKKQDMVPIEQEKLLENKKKLTEKYLDLFYHQDTETGKRTIRTEYVKICGIFRWASYALMSIFLLLFLFAQIPVFNNYKWFPYEWVARAAETMYLYPTLSFIILFEIVDFLDGEQAEKEPDEKLQSDEADRGVLVTDYDKAVVPLKKTFRDRFRLMLDAPESVANPENRTVTFQTELARQVYEYMRVPVKPPKGNIHLLSDPLEQERNPEIYHLIDSLEQGKDCLADASLYTELGTAFMAYLNVCLSRGDNILVLCADDQEVRNVSRYLNERLKVVNQFSPVWVIKTEYKAMQSGDCDILVTTPPSLENEMVKTGQEQFLSHVRMIIAPNTVKMMGAFAGSFAWLMQSFSTLVPAAEGTEGGETASRDGRFVLLLLNEGLPAELRKTAEQMAGRTLTVHDCRYSEDTTRIVVWDAEGNKGPTRLQERLFGEAFSSPYIGMLIPFALASFRLSWTETVLLSDGIPYRDILESLNAHAGEVKEYLEDDQGLADFTSRLLYQYGYHANNDPVILVEDRLNNLPSTLRTATRYRGTRGALVQVLSPRYMLRDYFISRQDGETPDLTGDQGLFPLYILSDAWKLKKIAGDFRHLPSIPEKVLLAELQDVEDLAVKESDTLEEALQKFREYILGAGTKDSLQYDFVFDWEPHFNERKATFEYDRTVRLREGLLKKAIFQATHEALLCYADEQMRLGFIGENAYQHYLPGQAVVCEGVMYLIDRIDRERGLLYASAAPESLESSTEFLQDREYTLKVPEGETLNSEVWDAPGKTYGKVRVTLSLIKNMKATIRTRGYYALLPYDPVIRPESMVYHELGKDAQPRAERKINTQVLSFRMTAAEGTNTLRASILLAVVLQELMKTFFPYSWQEIAVCPVPEEESNMQELGNVFATEFSRGDRDESGEKEDGALERNGGTKALLSKEDVLELLYGKNAYEQMMQEEESRTEDEERAKLKDWDKEDSQNENEEEDQETSDEEGRKKARIIRMEHNEALTLEMLNRVYPTLKAFPFRRKSTEIGVLFIQDSFTDNGMIQTLHKELNQPQSRLLSLVRDYLGWVADEPMGNDDFLCYGGATLIRKACSIRWPHFRKRIR